MKIMQGFKDEVTLSVILPSHGSLFPLRFLECQSSQTFYYQVSLDIFYFFRLQVNMHQADSNTLFPRT